MSLRKLLNRPKKKQFNLLVTDAEIILGECNKIARKEIEDQLKLKNQVDGNCLDCGANEDDVITKLIETSTTHFRVNHCLKCENEWNKYQTKKISQTVVLRVALRYLRDILKDPIHKKIPWKVETIEMFDGSYAETVYKLNKVKDKFMFPDLTLLLLRKNFRSVFDK